MPGIDRCRAPEQIPMPPLEPLPEPSGEVPSESLHDRSSLPPLLGTRSSSAPRHTLRNMGQLMRDLTAPLKLSLVLENKGNVARDHLASERTYLAYVRTSLATASAGVALVQLFTMTPRTSAVNAAAAKFAKPLGAVIVLFGLVILVLGLFRYFTTQSALIRGYFPVARNSITTMAFGLGSLVGVVFGIIVAGSQG